MLDAQSSRINAVHPGGAYGPEKTTAVRALLAGVTQLKRLLCIPSRTAPRSYLPSG